MGNDGGSIPTRRELVKEAAKALTAAQLKEAQIEQQEYGWTTDPLTRKPLSRPIVSTTKTPSSSSSSRKMATARRTRCVRWAA
jgi:hypothetical protein